ncbi:MAG: flavoprotein [Candidatus Hodarchaeales archaeon]
MAQCPILPSFLSNQKSLPILWCYTGGGHFFEENFTELLKINEKSIPICLVFSTAGVLIANRYGFFWKLVNSSIKKDLIHLIFTETVAQNNIKTLLDQGDFSYTVVKIDPAYSIAFSLANIDSMCIIASPLTANIVAKLVHGIADCIISNLLSAGLKSEKKIAIVPTDWNPQRIKSWLPVRLINPTKIAEISAEICNFHAIQERTNNEIHFLPQLCVGCQQCVKKFPQVFSYGDEIEVKIRKIDSQNVQKLSPEVSILQKPGEISAFIKQNCSR